MRILASLALGGLLLAACSSEASTPPSTAETSGEESATTPMAFAGVAWDAMSKEQKGDYMKQVIKPEMQALMASFDAEEGEEFGCKSCHGDNAKEVGFEMPNGLHPLVASEIESMPNSDDEEEARWAVFMMKKWEPKMAALLGKQPYDPATGQGFSCFDCHAQAE